MSEHQDLSEHEEELLWQVLQVPNLELQHKKLDELCAGDTQLQERLLAQVRLQPAAKVFFQQFEHGAQPDGLPHHEIERSNSLTEAPRQFGRFEIETVLGFGGMGTVFKARDPQLDRFVALKIPRWDLAVDANNRKRFLHEARTAANLSHAFLIPVYEIGAVGATNFIASKWCADGDLANWISRNKKPVQTRCVARFMAKVCRAIMHCHSQNVIHLDLKPTNILLQRSETTLKQKTSPVTNATQQGVRAHISATTLDDFDPLVTDFGISRRLDTKVTNQTANLVLGTPLYTAPEQIVHKLGPVDGRADIYALGVIMLELLGVQVPRTGLTFPEIVESIHNAQDPRAIKIDPDIPRPMRNVIARCIATDPAHRYATVEQLHQDLVAIAAGNPVNASAFTVADSMITWLRNPNRVRDAWIVSLAVNLVLLFWESFSVWKTFGDSFPGNDRISVITAMCGIIIGNSLPMLILAWFGLCKMRWPLYFAFTLTLLVSVIVPILVLTGQLRLVSVYDQSDYFESINHVLVLSAGLIQLSAFLVALLTFRKRRTGKRNSNMHKTTRPINLDD